MASAGGALDLLVWLVLLRPQLGAPFAPSAAAPPSASPEAPALERRMELPGLFTSECGHRSMRIVGGRPAAERKWPWQVTLQTRRQHICGGSLITNRWVLTAAHCIFGHLEYVVKLGDTNLGHRADTAVMVPVQDIIVHRAYSPIGTIRNDIALALLAFPVNYTTHVQPVCLPARTFRVEADTLCWVTGWGKLRETDTPDLAPTRLQEAEQNIIRHERCNKMLQQLMKTRNDLVNKGTICGYNNEGKDSCQGDSGGPLVCEFNDTWVQVGIVSWGIGCGRRGFPGVYTEVSFYKDWVMRQVSQGPGQDSAGVLLLGLCLGILVTP